MPLCLTLPHSSVLLCRGHHFHILVLLMVIISIILNNMLKWLFLDVATLDGHCWSLHLLKPGYAAIIPKSRRFNTIKVSFSRLQSPFSATRTIFHEVIPACCSLVALPEASLLTMREGEETATGLSKLWSSRSIALPLTLTRTTPVALANRKGLRSTVFYVPRSRETIY